ncbi:2-oxo-4-hydroxy-4-carboxy-5-ureidoimidazoline decarboxylase [Acinetobacter qingfengensis]|uniref:2-oxo-4-hydroxy-4-carboxy-5-ureidoimidazoline decarboxylase n=1 Tax=Acinetobacter qingfengensis TaxID=1262585 RepID=A0A1E7R9F0_9GAMM|nr:2-oxo-4-hydroxy-4-carboxy-5-ureidoimidazoline decarboxylase [Acinetobacter qingfengensis]KAA8735469.1 2-oxo-4-hydroxy-4-carboxy-5-ureidoimidazoline decarboxylase [Acinetobacter qingfengensis]OEY95887.1 OHCU decarboxylase [Acinetobacter qingfengensis]
MHLQAFNQIPEQEAKSILKNCVHIASWVNFLVAQRPFQSIDALYQSAQYHTKQWQWSEVYTALAQHPRIGQKKAAQELSQKEQNFSAQEQGKLELSNTTAQLLLDGNQTYEDQFGFIFLIRAAGRSTEEILSELHRRLKNSDEAEHLEVIQQLAEIAVLRLKQEIIA